jgi:hypothetical protein
MEKDEMIPVSHYCIQYKIETNFIRSLNEAGLVQLVETENENYIQFEEMSLLEKYIRLHQDLDINPEGIEAIAHLLKKIELMQQEIFNLKERLRIYE